MNIAIVNPIAATPDISLHELLRVSTGTNPLPVDALREVNIVELGEAIAGLGHRVTIVLAEPYLGARAAVLGPNLVVTPVHNLMRFPFHPGLLPMTPELVHHPALGEADILQTGEFHQPATFFASEVALDRGIPLVLWQETFQPMRFPGSLYQRGFESIVGHRVRTAAARCVPRTSKAHRYLRSLGIPEDLIPLWIPTGINVGAFAPRESAFTPSDFGWDEGCSVLLVVARLHPNKGLDDALRLLAHLLRTRTDARLLIRGSGPQEGELRQLAAALHLTEFVRFLPRMSRAQMVDLYNLAKVVLSTSRFDLLPFSLIEASACGRPIVATDVGAVTDIVIEGQTGRLLPAGEPESAAARVAGLLQDDERRAAFGRAARERAERYFNVESTAARLIEVYDAVAE